MEKPKTDFLVRTESIRQMERTVNGLFSAAGQSGESSAAVGKAMRQALSARCIICSLELTGSELSLLAHSPLDLEGNRIVRLRQSRCAREGCESHLYKLTFKRDEQVDWEKLFGLAKSAEQSAGADTETVAETVEEVKPMRLHPSVPSRTMLARVGVLAGVVVLLFVWHQMYFGGKIPFIRQPEKFRVAVSPDEADAHTDKAIPQKPVISTSATRVNGGSDDK